MTAADERKKFYDRNKPLMLGDGRPFGTPDEWADYCDWINKENKYAAPDAPMFPKSIFFITRHGDDPQIEGFAGLDSADDYMLCDENSGGVFKSLFGIASRIKESIKRKRIKT